MLNDLQASKLTGTSGLIALLGVRRLASQCAAEGISHPDYLLRLAQMELTDRHQRMVQRRVRAARFPAIKGLYTFDFSAIPSVNQPLVMPLARCECFARFIKGNVGPFYPRA